MQGAVDHQACCGFAKAEIWTVLNYLEVLFERPIVLFEKPKVFPNW